MSSLSQSEPVEKRSSHGLAHFVDHDVVDRQIDGNDTDADLAGGELARSKPDPLPI